MSKKRLSASVDAALLAAAEDAVAGGRANNVSAWVNEALQRQVDHDRRMRALDEFIAAYEAEYGVIGDEEIRAATRRARRGSLARPAAGHRARPVRRRGA